MHSFTMVCSPSDAKSGSGFMSPDLFPLEGSGSGVKGRILSIDHAQQRGLIAGDNGHQRSFERREMIPWLQFDVLRRGAQVE
jgi:hypothetical protein